MARKKQTDTYEVRSVNTGVLVCGPYTAKKDAEREVKRLNQEAATGRRADGGVVNGRNDPLPILHLGARQEFETVEREAE